MNNFTIDDNAGVVVNIRNEKSSRSYTRRLYGLVYDEGTRPGYLTKWDTWMSQRLRDRFNEHRDEITAVLWSYGTPIAWNVAGTWFVPDVRYSVTTSKHQGLALRYLPDVRIIPEDCGVDDFDDVLMNRKVFVGRGKDMRTRPVK